VKILVLNGNMPHFDYGLNRALAVINGTLAELGMELEEIPLAYSQIPYYDGMRAQSANDIIGRIRMASGVVIGCTAQLFAPTAIVQTFLEFLQSDEYKDVLTEKHCMLLTISRNGGERSALDYLARVVQHMGGFDSVRIGLQEAHTVGLAKIPDVEAMVGSIQDILEKGTEDFYRAIRQNRRYIVPRDVISNAVMQQYTPPQTQSQYFTNPQNMSNTPNLQNMQNMNNFPNMANMQNPQHGHANQFPQQQMQQQYNAPQYQQPQQTQQSQQNYQYQQNPQPIYTPPTPPPQPKTDTVAEVTQKLNLDAFTERQEEDIKELTALFAQKYQDEDPFIAKNNQAPPLTTPNQQAPYSPQAAPPNLSNMQNITNSPDMANLPNMPNSPNLSNAQNLPHMAPLSTTPNPRVKTVKQVTQSLPHYYQPQLAGGLTAVIQFCITGEETFDGYLTIVDNECEYIDGTAQNPEITIIADSYVWSDVLKGRHTAQKAFMIGGLKVRGNFVLLTKFDTLFKMQK